MTTFRRARRDPIFRNVRKRTKHFHVRSSVNILLYSRFAMLYNVCRCDDCNRFEARLWRAYRSRGDPCGDSIELVRAEYLQHFKKVICFVFGLTMYHDMFLLLLLLSFLVCCFAVFGVFFTFLFLCLIRCAYGESRKLVGLDRQNLTRRPSPTYRLMTPRRSACQGGQGTHRNR